MKTINHECYVSLEVAKLLKEAEFDWDVYKVYELNQENKKLFGEIANWQGKAVREDVLPMPTLDAAQRWLRENKDFDINILTDFDSVKRLYYVRYVVKDGHYKTYYITKNRSYVYFNTYEEAQEAGIEKALELILEKGE